MRSCKTNYYGDFCCFNGLIPVLSTKLSENDWFYYYVLGLALEIYYLFLLEEGQYDSYKLSKSYRKMSLPSNGRAFIIEIVVESCISFFSTAMHLPSRRV